MIWLRVIVRGRTGHHELLVLLDDAVLARGGDLLGLALHAEVLGREHVRELLEAVEDGGVHQRVHAEEVEDGEDDRHLAVELEV